MGMAAPNGRGRNGSSPCAGESAGPNGRVNGQSAGRVNGRAKMKLSFTIPSDFEASRGVQQRIMQDVESNGFDPESSFAIRIAMEEAIVNAIRHGNGQDPGKHVHVEASVTPQSAEIVVEDEGPGFDRGRVPDPTAHENLVRPCGRGILLIESYMSDVRWEQGGRRVRMVKRKEPAAQA